MLQSLEMVSMLLQWWMIHASGCTGSRGLEGTLRPRVPVRRIRPSSEHTTGGRSNRSAHVFVSARSWRRGDRSGRWSDARKAAESRRWRQTLFWCRLDAVPALVRRRAVVVIKVVDVVNVIILIVRMHHAVVRFVGSVVVDHVSRLVLAVGAVAAAGCAEGWSASVSGHSVLGDFSVQIGLNSDALLLSSEKNEK